MTNPGDPVAEAKNTAVAAVDGTTPRLQEVAAFLHSHPEIGLQEATAKAFLSDFLAAEGFAVGPGVPALPTSFEASWRQGCARPRIAFLAEYDALPGLGHACGHNLIAAVALGAAMATRTAMVQHGLAGTVLVYGTPAEEGAVDGAGGKIYFVEAGRFRDVDAALMAHPSSRTTVEGGAATGRVALEITFHGRSAHAAGAPEEGINALDAAILTFNAWNALRQHVRDDVRIHGIITEGGKSPNIIPDLARIRMYVRARDPAYLEEVEQRVKECAEGAARATGARVEFRYTARTYQSLLPNETLSRLYRHNLGLLGVVPHPPAGRSGGGSSDAGNVSHVVPLIHPYFAVCPLGTPLHSPDFAHACGRPEALRAATVAAKALAMTAVDLLMQPRLIKEAKNELAAKKAALTSPVPSLGKAENQVG